MDSNIYVIIDSQNQIVNDEYLEKIDIDTIASFMIPIFESQFADCSWMYDNIIIGDFTNNEAALHIKLLLDFDIGGGLLETKVKYEFYRIWELEKYIEERYPY